MTPNHLAGAKVTLIKDKSTIRALLERSKHNLTVSIPRRITIVDDSPLDVSVTIKRIGKETIAEIDAIATSINMMPLIDPTAVLAARSSESDVLTMGVTGGSGLSARLGVRADGCGVTWLAAWLATTPRASSAAAADARAISSYTSCRSLWRRRRYITSRGLGARQAGLVVSQR
eukprot:scaffold61821_cov97-Phaeocystis_antarctica.AAC.2